MRARSAPFATLEAVQQAVRARIADARARMSRLSCAKGLHARATLRFGPEDGGTDKRRVTYRAYPGVGRLTGGRAITGWEKQAGTVGA